jgi:hypothetical protein
LVSISVNLKAIYRYEGARHGHDCGGLVHLVTRTSLNLKYKMAFGRDLDLKNSTIVLLNENTLCGGVAKAFLACGAVHLLREQLLLSRLSQSGVGPAPGEIFVSFYGNFYMQLRM